MLCKKCIHKSVCDMWIKFVKEVALYRDVDTDKIPDLSKTKDCQYLQSQSHRATKNMWLRLKAFTKTLLRKASHILKRCAKF